MSSKPEKIELLSFEEVRENMDKPLLQKQVAHCLENSSFYREKYGEARIGLADAGRPETFAELPFTDKMEVLEDQKSHPPFGRLAVQDVERIRRIHTTSGSTGQPFRIVLTDNDVTASLEAGRRALSCAGLTPNDTIIHCLNYCLWSGGLTDHMSLEATGATVIPFGVGNSRLLIETILDLHPTAISCTPSYMSRLEMLLEEEFGLEPRQLGLKKALFGGEGGVQQPAFRRSIEDKWGMKAIDANYGMSDVLSVFGSECHARAGLHFHGQGLLLLELIDPRTSGLLPIREGQAGEMVLTNLRREAQPFLRFRTGDVIRIEGTGQCVCGRKSLRFSVVGRADDMITIRGVNVFPGAVRSILTERPEWFSGEFEFVVNKNGPLERPLLRIELARETNPAQVDIEAYLRRRCRDLSFTPVCEFLQFGDFPRTEGKTRRVRHSEKP